MNIHMGICHDIRFTSLERAEEPSTLPNGLRHAALSPRRVFVDREPRREVSTLSRVLMICSTVLQQELSYLVCSQPADEVKHSFLHS